MKIKMLVFTMVVLLAISSLVYGFTSIDTNGSTEALALVKPSTELPKVNCPLEGTSECPKLGCPLAGTPDCPYEKAEVPSCCKGK